jgi:ferric-dicitrate binding protein FerR (iron transport regulator)
MSGPPEDALEELFLAYWDDTLSDTQSADLTRRLATDPQAREAFEAYCLNAVVAADLPVEPVPEPTPEPTDAPSGSGRQSWSRRRLLQFLVSGLAAGVAGVLVLRPSRPEPPRPGRDLSIRLGSIQGEVALVAPDGSALPTDGPVVPGSTIRTTGPSTSAVLFFPNGTNLALSGDSDATLSRDGNRLDLHEGVVTADVRPPLVGGTTMTLATPWAVMANLREVIMTLDQAPNVTEVGVRHGSVSVAGPTGRPLGEVRGGELLTLRSDGPPVKGPIPQAPESFAWDLSRPLPRGWGVGPRVVTPDGPGVRTAIYKDPYYGGTPMYQIRSDKQWTRGFFRLDRGSVVRVKYRADRAGRGQVCFCTRMADAGAPDTGVLEWNGTYAASAPGNWNVLEVPAEAMLLPPNKHVPKFCQPWVSFLVIFNTFEDDIGLTVSEFRVTGPNGLQVS